MPVAIRINGVGSKWHSPDLDAVARSNADLVVIPRAISAHLVLEVAETVGKPVLAMIETAAGVLAGPQIAHNCAALIVGTNAGERITGTVWTVRALALGALRKRDVVVGRCSVSVVRSYGASRETISASLQMIVLAARAAGIAAFDGVFNNLDDADGFIAEAQDGRRLGFDGKSLIHPNQIALCHRAFAPDDAEVERAKALVAAFRGGAERFGNEMIERMHVTAAQRVLERAGD